MSHDDLMLPAFSEEELEHPPSGVREAVLARARETISAQPPSLMKRAIPYAAAAATVLLAAGAVLFMRGVPSPARASTAVEMVWDSGMDEEVADVRARLEEIVSGDETDVAGTDIESRIHNLSVATRLAGREGFDGELTHFYRELWSIDEELTRLQGGYKCF